MPTKLIKVPGTGHPAQGTAEIDPGGLQQHMTFEGSSDGRQRSAGIAEILADRFVLEQLAGRGGMGEVYRALDRRTGQPVAIKILRDPQASLLARFEREARILAELAHPSIVRYVAHGVRHTGEPFLAMEWLDGHDLAFRLSRERPGASDSLALALAVAEALAVLHERGVVHRDLKPSNVFLVDGRIDRVKLLDFGLARVDESTRMTSTGTLLGTLDYMAPEQARGDEVLDARVDVFALGCVLFECLTGERPFAAEHPTAVLTKLLFEEAPRLGDRRPGIPAELDALVARMLAKRAGERPRDARAAADALRAVLDLRPSWSGGEPTLELRRPAALTDSEQRVMAVILVGAPEGGAGRAPEADAQLEREAAAHGGAFERLVDGAGAVLLSGAAVATDLAGQAARCALALRRHVPGRRIALGLGKSAVTARLAVGPAIDQAARLLGIEVAHAPGTADALVTVDDTTAGLLETRFDVRRSGGAFVLYGERDVTDARTLLGKPTPCVGRARELAILDQMFEQCAAERAAQAVLVTAPPGAGKSRLAQEYLQAVRRREAPPAIWIARGNVTSAGSAFGLARQVLREACGIRAGEPIEVRREKLRARVAETVGEPDRWRVTELLGEMLCVPFPGEESVALLAARTDPQLMHEQMRAAFLDFVAAACARSPVVILLEDLHWGDRATVQLLDRALRDLGDQPLFVLALARPEVHDVFPRLWAERASQEIRLRALDGKAVARLARHVLGEGISAETIERLARLSEGNAFHLEELIRATAEAAAGELPRTVVAMVQSRLGALDGESRRLLRAASVFGETFWSGGAAVLLGGEAHGAAVRARIAELVEQELLVRRGESRFPGEQEFAFRHALVWEGAYAMLTDEDRALGHRLAGEWLEARGEDARILAAHFEKGADGERAGRHYLRAVELASTAGDMAAAIADARRGLASGVTGAPRIALLGLLCETHLFQLELAPGALPHAEEVVQVAPRGSAPWVQGMLILQTCALQAGELDRFQEVIRALLDVEPSPEGAVPLALSFMGAVHMFDLLGAIAQADAVIERHGALAARFRDLPLVQCYWHASLGMRAGAVREDPAGGLAHSAEATAIAAAIGHRRYMMGSREFQGMQRWLLGEAASARQILEQAELPDEQYALASSFRPFALAWLLADEGALDEARTWALRLVEVGRARRLVLDEGRGHWALAEVRRRAGELEAADLAIEAAFATLGAVCPLDVPGLHATRAALRLAQGRAGEAAADAAAGMARYEAIGACSFFARGAFLRLVHAESLDAAGRRDDARAAVAGARRRLLANADKIADPIARARFLDGVPEHRRTLALAAQWLDQAE